MEAQKRVFNKKIIIGVLLVVLAIAGAGVYYWQYQKTPTDEQVTHKAHINVLQEYRAVDSQNVDFFKISRDFEEAFIRYPTAFDSKESEAISKIAWADSLSEIDRKKGIVILKEVALNPEYPNKFREKAIRFIVNDYELDFIDSGFAEQNIFTGEFFENFLIDADGDVKLAIRKLNEWGNSLFPGIITSYRIAKWYASQIYQNQSLSDTEKNSLLNKMNEYVAMGDNFMQQYGDRMLRQRQGLAYELKARIIHLSAGDKEQADKFFKMSMQAYMQAYESPLDNVYQIVYRARHRLYYAAFLARNYGVDRTEDIQRLLKPIYDYLSVFQEPRQRNVRMVSFLIAARDSTSADYPFIDFNKTDIEAIKKIYPEFGAIIDKLDFLEYIKGHPLEMQIIE